MKSPFGGGGGGGGGKIFLFQVRSKCQSKNCIKILVTNILKSQKNKENKSRSDKNQKSTENNGSNNFGIFNKVLPELVLDLKIA